MADPLTASLALAGGSTILSLKGQKDEHKANQAQMARRKAELEKNAKTAIAVSQREASEETRRAKIVASRARALAAFGGAGADDKTVMDIISDIEGEGEYRRNVELYKGKETARRMLEDAAATAEAMRAEKRAFKTKQLSTLFNFGRSAASSFGGGAPSLGSVGSGEGYDYQASQVDSQWGNWGD